MATTRTSLIDYIDNYYNTLQNWELLDRVMIALFGDKILDSQGEIDDNGPDGMYSRLSNSELVQLADKLDAITEGKSYEVNLKLTSSQLSTLKKMLSEYSDVSFTRDQQMSKDATLILQQLY